MGMAASQARYLGLTARKTNVEYEGQQINQARTALANQSADTFNQLLGLSVPVAPDKNKFITLQYSYTDGTTGETISNMTELNNDPDGYNYLVTHYHFANLFKGVESRRTNPQVSMNSPVKSNVDLATTPVTQVGTDYYKDGQIYDLYDSTDLDQAAAWKQLKEKYGLGNVTDADVFVMTDPTDGLLHFATRPDLAASAGLSTGTMPEYYVDPNSPSYVGNNQVFAYDSTDKDLKAAYEQIIADFPNSTFANSTPDQIYYWKDAVTGKTQLACHADLKASGESAVDPTYPTENQTVKLLQYNAQDVKTKIEQRQKAFVEFDGSGRAQSIRYEDSSIVHSLSTEQITDDDAYENAMNQYNYDVRVYEKTIEDINAKTKRIQEQDRTLELRLRQLDTEQDALQTEMEAVKKVIEKNIESTFKTFE